MALNFKNCSELFSIPPETLYLNSAYMGPFLNSTLKAGHQGLQLKVQPWKMDTPTFFNPVEKARGLFAQLIQASEENVALIPSASYGACLLYTSPSPRDRQKSRMPSSA